MGFKYQESQVTKTQRVVVGATCDSCGCVLKPVWKDWSDREQAEDALDILLSGGYGQYFDGPGIRLVFCRDCADKLVKDFPGINKYF